MFLLVLLLITGLTFLGRNLIVLVGEISPLTILK